MQTIECIYVTNYMFYPEQVREWCCTCDISGMTFNIENILIQCALNYMVTVKQIKCYVVCIAASPYWEVEPESVDASDNETAVFHCIANGIPEPVNFWYINSIPISSKEIQYLNAVTVYKHTCMNEK